MFKKAMFPIQMIKAAPRKVELVKGYIKNDYGFHKGKKNWIATDLLSGCEICQGKTRKECFEWIEQNKELLNRVKQERNYHEKVLNFYKLLKIELS